MKSSLFIVLILFLTQSSHAQLTDVPNSRFVYWHKVFNYEDPDSWITNNDTTFSGVRRDTTTWNGTPAMQILQNGLAISALFKPRGFFFTCYYVSNIVGVDTVVLKAITYLKGIAIDSNQKNLTATQTYLYWEAGVGLKQYPDSVRIMFIGGHNAGTTLSVRNLYTWSESVEDISNKLQQKIRPNPMTEMATFHFRNPEHKPYDWALNDITGKTILLFKNVRTEEISIQRNSLSCGTYIWQIWDADKSGSASGKLIIE